ncbi:MAG: hypothetical protein M3Q65_07875, partial [Chloroflexota bacterium]|nr:hypothetical protein [Chloroflexota bacterium]
GAGLCRQEDAALFLIQVRQDRREALRKALIIVHGVQMIAYASIVLLISSQALSPRFQAYGGEAQPSHAAPKQDRVGAPVHAY